jgi:signal transduction histidine kinase
LKEAERKLKTVHQLLKIANRHNEMKALLNDFVLEIKKLTGCSAVGMRVADEDGNIPYQAYDGFDRKHYESENAHYIGANGCMCSSVLQQETDQSLPYLTPAGSFYAESTTRVLNAMSPEERAKTCNLCNRFGYESVALVPIRAGDLGLGLIHVADSVAGRLTLDKVEDLEGAAMHLGSALLRVQAEEALKLAHGELEGRVAQRTADLVLANEQLNREIEERRRAEEELIRHREQLRALSSELLLAEEKERRRIAVGLHDSIGQALAISKIRLGALRGSVSSNETAEQLDEIHKLIEEMIQETRSLTFELSPPLLYELGLEAALESLVDQILEQHDIRITFQDDGRPKPLDDSHRVTIFQACRELLFNIIKHARASNAGLSIRREDENVRVEIEDDGDGFSTPGDTSRPGETRGFGLFSIRERLSHLGGHLRVESEPGSGTRISMVLPLSPDEKDEEKGLP